MSDGQTPPRLHVPHTQGLVPLRGDHPFSIRRDGDAGDAIAVPLQSPYTFPALQVPHAYGLVPAARRRHPPIGRHADSLKPVGVSLQRLKAAPTLQVPHPHRVACPAARHGSAVPRDGHGAHRPSASFPGDTTALGTAGTARFLGIATRSAVFSLTDTALRPSGVTATLLTHCLSSGTCGLCPCRVRTHCPLSESHT